MSITPRASDIVRTTKILIPDDKYKKLFSYIEACDTEVGGLATIKKIDDTTFEVDEIFICKQVAGPAYLRLEDADMLKLGNKISNQFITNCTNKLMELAAKPKLTITDIVGYKEFADNGQKNQNKILLQWHSHVNMATSASNTDYDTALRLSVGKPYYFMLIMNKHHRNTCYMITRSPIGSWEQVDCLFNSLIESTEAEKEAAKAEIAANVFNEREYTHNETTGIIEKGIKVYDLPIYDQAEDFIVPKFRYQNSKHEWHSRFKR